MANPEVYRNARYELRLVAIEAQIIVLSAQLATMCDGMAFAMNSLQSLALFLKAQSEALPGEHHNEGSARIH